MNRLRQSFSWWCFENRGVPATHLLKEAKTIGYHGVDLLLEGLWDQRDPRLGLEQLEEAVVLLRQAGDWRFLAQTLGILGCAVLSNGELESAQEFLDEAYELNQQSNNSAMEFVLTGKPEVAARLIGWSDATRAEIGDPRPRIEQADLDQDIAALKAKIGADVYEAAYNAGQGLTLDEAVAFASGGKEQG